MFSTLPSETIDYILDYLHDDRSALLACSLTCKGWLSCSRYHLFSEVLLHNSNVDSFMELLDIEWTSVGPAIQRLTLDQLEPGSDRNSRPIHASPNVPRLVYHLYNVVSLRVSRVIWENAPQSVQELVSCINFKHLEIRFTSFKTYSQLANIICASPMLHTLSLSGIYWESSGSSALHLQRRPFRLHYLGLHSFGRLRICVEWLLTQSPVPPVQFLCVHLDVAAVEPEVIPFLRTFMRTAGASVERLRILVPTNIPDSSPDHPLCHFATFTNIRFLHLGELDLGYEGCVPRNLQELAGAIISQVSSRHLEEVYLTLRVLSMGVLGRCDLSGLADLFIKASIPNLQKIYLCLEDWDQLDQTEAKKILRNSAFSAFDARGALCIRFLQGDEDDVYVDTHRRPAPCALRDRGPN